MSIWHRLYQALPVALVGIGLWLIFKPAKRRRSSGTVMKAIEDPWSGTVMKAIEDPWSGSETRRLPRESMRDVVSERRK